MMYNINTILYKVYLYYNKCKKKNNNIFSL